MVSSRGNSKEAGKSSNRTQNFKEEFSSESLRKSFLEFFKEKRHRVVKSAPLIPSDPTLLFTSAGMVQFKTFYTDPDSASFPRAASVQKCLRAGGKQSDLENVGRTLRHHTFFEMLGNFSFGDYFKKETIEYAWELVVDVWGMDSSKLWVSVYEEDREAFDLWAAYIGFPEDRIVRLGKKDNFWGPVGDTGVCGPSSEIYFDTGEGRSCGQPECKPGCDCDRYMEFWNLVFPQFFLTTKGTYDPLPSPGIDTGLGLERLAVVLQEVEDNFHTDLFFPIREAIVSAIPGKRIGDESSMAVNVAADHLRALCFTMAEGIIPSNEGRGYVLRRLLRRALTKMHPLGVVKPFLAEAVDSIVDVMGERYPELQERREFIKKVIIAEEERFLGTLEQGLERLESVIARCKKEGSKSLSGENVFVLYDTYGFPPELTNELAGERGLTVDIKGYFEAMARQKERARRKGLYGGGLVVSKKEFSELRKVRETKFLGYDKLMCQGKISAYRILDEEDTKEAKEAAIPGRLLEIITDETVFYPAGGGQVGDRGIIECSNFRVEVMDTYRIEERIVHQAVWRKRTSKGEVREKDLKDLFAAEKCRLVVDETSRFATQRNHTATHILHAALREILGEHVLQAGSLVAPDRFRFDFSHFQALSEKEITGIEDFVNTAVLSDLNVRMKEIPYQEALNSGVMALFGEKYGEYVRVVEVEDTSRELCGGTHVKRTGEIGAFLIRNESAVSAGVRRIEALTGTGALHHIRCVMSELGRIARDLKTSPEDVGSKIEDILSEAESLKKRFGSQKHLVIKSLVEEALGNAKIVNGITLLNLQLDGEDISTLRKAGDLVREKLQRGVGLILLVGSKKPVVLVVASNDLVKEEYLQASSIVEHIGKEMSLSGGGKPHMAQVGIEKYDDFKEIERIVESYLGNFASRT